MTDHNRRSSDRPGIDTCDLTSLIDVMEIKARRDTVRAALVQALKTGAPVSEVVGLLAADDVVTADLKTAMGKDVVQGQGDTAVLQ